MGGKISDNTDVFENILTKQWRKNPHPKRVRIQTHLLKGEGEWKEARMPMLPARQVPSYGTQASR